MNPLQKCLRPTLHLRASRPCPAAAAAAPSYVRFYRISQSLASVEATTDATPKNSLSPSPNEIRTEAFRRSEQELHPRFSPHLASTTWTCRNFSSRFYSLGKGETSNVHYTALNGKLQDGSYEHKFTLAGRVKSVRMSSSGLAFIDIVHDGYLMQGVCDLGRISKSGTSETEFRDLFRKIRKGDIYSMG